MEINTTFLLPLGAMFVLLIIFRVIIFNAFVKLTSKTKSKHDDRIAEKLKRPLTLIPIGIGLYLLNDSLNLPDSIEIVCSTSAEGKLCTEVSATCINYTDYETQHKRRSFTFQFHPELLDDLREFNKSGMPSYEKLKNDDGIRMLIRVIYESITD